MGNKREPVNNDPLENLEEDYASSRESEGYKAGFEIGKRDGQREGYSVGFDEGAKRGAEVGYFKGYTMTHKHLISREWPREQKQPNQSSKARTLKKMDDLLDMIDNFPHTNETNSDEKLSILRAKFKQIFATATSTPKTTNT